GGCFHTGGRLTDPAVPGGSPPCQPMGTVANPTADLPGGVSGGATDLPFGMQGQDVEFRHPTAYMYSAGIQREIPFGFVVDVSYVGRKGKHLQREFNINQLKPGTLPSPVNIAALRPYLGYGAIRISQNDGRSTFNSLQ